MARLKGMTDDARFLGLCLFYIGGYLTAMGPRDGTQPISKGDYTAIVAIFLYATWYCFGWNSVRIFD